MGIDDQPDWLQQDQLEWKRWAESVVASEILWIEEVCRMGSCSKLDREEPNYARLCIKDLVVG